jgi:hyaluronan synthase
VPTDSPDNLRQRLARAGWERATRVGPKRRRKTIRGIVKLPMPGSSSRRLIIERSAAMLAQGAAATAPAIDRSARAIATALERVAGVGWPKVVSSGGTIWQAIVAAVSTLFFLLVRLARSTRAAVQRCLEVAWPSIAAGSASSAGLARATALRLAAGAARSCRRAAWAVERSRRAAALSLASAAVTFGRAIVAVAGALGNSVAHVADVTTAAVLRSINAASDEISVLSKAGRQAAADSARRTLTHVQRSAAMTAALFEAAGSIAWLCVSRPPIIVAQGARNAAERITTGTVRFANATTAAAYRATDIGLKIVSWPALAVAAVRADAPRALTRLAAIVVFLLCTANIFVLRWENFGYYWYRPFLNAYSIGVAAFILSRFLIALFYRPPTYRGLEPTVSIIITAFNEEDAIVRTIECSRWVDYPPEKLEVVVVDDGSTDGTLREIERVRALWPDLVVIAFDSNRGKREAMAAGARSAHGEILVYVDSDSFLRRDAVREIVQGFADPSVAAVAGHTDVANSKRNALTRMQDVRYYVAFRVLKAAESVFGAVTCCPGCFSAYRRQCVLPVLDRWLNQRFLGVRATFGDDRSLTNFLLRHYKVIYSSTAVATTVVPETHAQFLRQQLRWKKSWLRECLIAATFMWKKHPIAAVGFYAQLVFPILAPILLLRAFVWMPIVARDPLSMLLYGFGVTLIGLIFSSYYLFWRIDGTWLYGVYFTIYYMFVLVWQMPYAIVTSRDNRWGTR